MNSSLLIYSSDDGHLDCFLGLAAISGIAVIIFMYILCGTSFVCIPRNNIARLWGIYIDTVSFPKQLYQFIPPLMVVMLCYVMVVKLFYVLFMKSLLTPKT